MVKKRFETRRLADIHPYEKNPRRNDEAVADVMESIKQCENLDPIEVDEDGIILSGHTRLKALKKLGYTETDVVVYDGLTDEQKRKYRLLTNKTGEKALWDFDLLAGELDGLDLGGFDFGFDMKGVGLSEVAEVEPPDAPEVPVAKLGDIWLLGRHRLMCGDSTNASSVESLMGGGIGRHAPYGPTVWRRLHGENQGAAENRERPPGGRRFHYVSHGRVYGCGFGHEAGRGILYMACRFKGVCIPGRVSRNGA